MEKVRKGRVLDGLRERLPHLKSDVAIKIYSLLVVVLLVLFMSGLTYLITTDEPIPLGFLPDGSVRVFLWSPNAQSISETIVVVIYYLMGVGGLWLYVNAARGVRDARTTKYMLFFSFLLILLASIGIMTGFISKFQAP